MEWLPGDDLYDWLEAMVWADELYLEIWKKVAREAKEKLDRLADEALSK